MPYWPNCCSSDPETQAELSIAAIHKLFKEPGGFACLLAEPIRSTPHVPPRWYWPEIRRLCDAHATLLIFDEIGTGLGKTGRLFSSQHFQVAPDITILGKSLGGAVVPLSAIIARDSLNVTAEWAIGHFTHQKNPVLCRAGLLVLDILASEQLVEAAGDKGDYLLRMLNELPQIKPLFHNAKGIGLLQALEMTDGFCDQLMSLQAACYRRGLNCGTAEGRFLCLSPPLTVQDKELELAVDFLSEAAETVLDRLT